MLGLFRRKRRVPRKYLKPRPMASGARPQHRFWDLVPLEVAAGLVAALVALLIPVQAIDRPYITGLLAWMGPNAPPSRVLVTYVDTAELKRADCSRQLARASESGQPEKLLLMPPVHVLCPAPRGQASWLVLDPAVLRRSGDGEVYGFRSDRPSAALTALGVVEADWVAGYAWRSVPTVALSDLDSGRIDSSVLAQRIVIVALEDPAAEAVGSGPLAAKLAGALAGALELGPKPVLERSWLTVLVLLLSLAWYGIGRARLGAPARRASRLAVAGFVVSFWVGGLFGIMPLLPVPSFALAASVFFSMANLPRIVATRRAETGTREILSRAQEVGAQSPHSLPAEEFWERLARRIARAHPADGVLVAELPPFSWRLLVHPNGDLTEAIIRERRRDIRRWPYMDEHGNRPIHVIHDFVVTHVPTLLVPLEAAGEVEGYIFLVGKSAEDAFVARPELTKQLADEVALLIRRRRLEQQRADEWRRPAGVLVADPAERSQDLLLGARAVFDRLQLFGNVLHSASVGLMYADAFGDVRLLSRAFAARLHEVGLNSPEVGNAEMLPSGALPLPLVLQAFAKASGQSPPALEEITTHELNFEAVVAGATGRQRVLLLRISRLEGADHTGFVGSLVEIKHTPDAPSGGVERIPEAADPLMVFSLSQVLVDQVDVVVRRTQGQVRLQTPRSIAHVLGHRRELSEALEEFLVDAVRQHGGHDGPTLVIKERAHRVDLTVLDLRLGVPTAAVRRTLMAPSEPPPGLGPLGALARAVENSHGSLHLRDEEGWGSRLTVSLIRARPRLEPSTVAPVVDLRAVERRPRKK